MSESTDFVGGMLIHDLPLQLKLVVRRAAAGIFDPHDDGEVVLARGLLFDVDLAASAFVRESNVHAPRRKRSQWWIL